MKNRLVISFDDDRNIGFILIFSPEGEAARTETELKLMAAAAIIGLSKIPSTRH